MIESKTYTVVIKGPQYYYSKMYLNERMKDHKSNKETFMIHEVLRQIIAKPRAKSP